MNDTLDLPYIERTRAAIAFRAERREAGDPNWWMLPGNAERATQDPPHMLVNRMQLLIDALGVEVETNTVPNIDRVREIEHTLAELRYALRVSS